MSVRVIGVGKSLFEDDSVGIRIARQVAASSCGNDAGFDVVELETVGIELMEAMVGADKVIVIDALCAEGVPPGTLVRIDPRAWTPSLPLGASHGLGLPDALTLGRELGYAMPREVVVFGVQARSVDAFDENLTPEVEAAVPRAVAAVLAELRASRTG